MKDQSDTLETDNRLRGPGPLRSTLHTTRDAVTIRFEGEIDLVTGPLFREQLEEAAGLRDDVIVDLRGVTYLDSKAITHSSAVTTAPSPGRRAG